MDHAPHTFHIPVMGLGYTIDTPVKVAHWGISSVVSIIEDELVERMREHHCRLSGEAFVPIPDSDQDHRALRVTAYLDLLKRIVDRNMARVKGTPIAPGSESARYFEMLPEGSALHRRYEELLAMPACTARERAEEALRAEMVPGAIDANIMAKIDPVNYDADGRPLPDEFCDAMAALRGFAKSQVSGGLVLSAGYNPRLYAYIAAFPDFLPDAQGLLRKKVILKVSDLRSAQVQGRLLAKKGVWVSEYRIESGLNCGGHAFPTDGLLMGQILAEFKEQREALADELWRACNKALEAAGRPVFAQRPPQRIAVQGGIGTAAEDRLLRTHYGVDGTGWGSPFLLVPEATNVESHTLDQLLHSRPEDFFLSDASPLGVPFHNFRPSTSRQVQRTRIQKGRPGSPCYKKFLSANTEFTERPICTASRQYQNLKIKQLRATIQDPEALAREEEAVLAKECLCEGLGASALLTAGMTPAHKLEAVTICPGPNLAYFHQSVPLATMIDHIYGRTDILGGADRPHMFINEARLYIDYLKGELDRAPAEANPRQARRLHAFHANLLEGLAHCAGVLRDAASMIEAPERMRSDLERLQAEVRALAPPAAVPVA